MATILTYIKERVLEIPKSKGITKEKFFSDLGLNYGNYKGKAKEKSLSSDVLATIITNYPEINPQWLLTGTGEMLKNDIVQTQEAIPFDITDNSYKPIPLVNVSAAAGFGSSDFHIQQEDVKDYYVIPKFKHYDIDFMIEVRGSSMYPKYNSGDVIACTILKQSNFIQWNKVHVIATKEQGLLVKRVKKGDCEECISAVSDNKEYDPFFIPKDEITGLAIVVGVIRLE